jgi:hypothetical protein
MYQTVGYWTRYRYLNYPLSKKNLLVVNSYVSGPSVNPVDICENILDTAKNLLVWRIFSGVLIPEQIVSKIILITGTLLYWSNKTRPVFAATLEQAG